MPRDADVGAVADAARSGALGEHLGVGRRARPGRYWDHEAVLAQHAGSTARASSEPGRTSWIELPMLACSCSRSSAARVMSPPTRSSMTRSSMLRTNVTPAAMMTCRSTGASSEGRSRAWGASAPGGGRPRSPSPPARGQTPGDCLARGAERGADIGGGVVALDQVGHRRAEPGDVVEALARCGHQPRSAPWRPQPVRRARPAGRVRQRPLGADLGSMSGGAGRAAACLRASSGWAVKRGPRSGATGV